MSALELFGDRSDLAVAYAELLSGDGVAHGHIGPREAGRLWDRHLVNSAVLTELIAPDARVVDVGSGAGLPGVPMAIRRSDLQVDLVEPMLRRTTFLERVCTELSLDEQVRVVRGRAEDVVGIVGGTDWVVARAVAPLDRLVRWCLPLLSPGGCLLALKGASAADEVDEHTPAILRAGASRVEVTELPGVAGGESTWVVTVERGRTVKSARARGRR